MADWKPPVFEGEIKNYTPTLRDRITYGISGLMSGKGELGPDRESMTRARMIANALDYTPVGIATAADDVTREVGRGDFKGAGLDLAMAMVPGPSLKHGSPTKGLDVIKKSERGPLGPGVYTSPADQISGQYAGPEGQIYSMPNDQYDVYTGAGYRDDAGYYGYKEDKQRLIAAAEPDKQAEVAALVERMGKLDGYPLYARLRILYGSDEGAQNLFKRAGFDGLSGLVDGPETLLFNEQKLR